MVSYKQLNKDQKLIYKKNLSELKLKQREEKNRRIEELKTTGSKHCYIKMLSGCFGDTRYNFIIPFTDEEIEMAKVCMLNSWDFPPPTFFDKFFVYPSERKTLLAESGLNSNQIESPKLSIMKSPNKTTHIPEINQSEYPLKTERIDESVISMEEHKKKNLMTGWSKETYMQLINNNLEIYLKSYEEPLKREKGKWIKIDEFFNLMNHYIVLHNPKFYLNSLTIDNNWHNYKTDIYEIPKENKIFLLTHNENYNNNNSKSIADGTSFLILFQSNSCENDEFSIQNSYIIFDLLEKNGTIIQKGKKLKDHYSSYQFDLLNKNQDYIIMITHEMCPFGYSLQLFTDHQIEAMSFQEYNKKYKGYLDSHFKADHPAVTKDGYYLIMRLKFEVLII